MSGISIKFTCLAQIEANQFASADDSLFLQEPEDLGAGVLRLGWWRHLQVAAEAQNRSAGGLSLRRAPTGRGKHDRIFHRDAAGHIFGWLFRRVTIRR